MKPELGEFLEILVQAARRTGAICVTKEGQEDIFLHLRAAQGIAVAEQLLESKELLNVTHGLMEIRK